MPSSEHDARQVAFGATDDRFDNADAPLRENAGPGLLRAGLAAQEHKQGAPAARYRADDDNQLRQECARLESRLSTLLDWLRQLQTENRALREAQRQLMEERARLIEKNELARNKVEQMIARLKAMENG